MNSETMKEILKIKEKNSAKYLEMTNEEINNELKNSLEWFLKASGKSKKIIVENNDKIISYVDIHSTTMTVNEETEKYD